MNTLENYGLCARFINEASQWPDLQIARVIAQYKGQYKIITAEKECSAEVAGKFRYDTNDLLSYPAVGDYVMVSLSSSTEVLCGTAIIHHVLTRKSFFERTAVGVSGQSQIIAANIDVVFICMSLNQNYNLNRLERYLSIAWDSGATPVVLLTKADLCVDLQAKQEDVARVAGFADVVVTSVCDEASCSKVLEYIKPGLTASFLGSSGVGKSTLINKLMGDAQRTVAQTGRQDKGRHTTTSREMMILPNGGIVIDTPGMREIGVESADLSKTFTDIEELEEQCRFRNCTHTAEPGCAVLEAVASGCLEARRLDNYFKLKREAKYQGLSSRAAEAEKFNEMFKDIGGMKNIRRFNRQNDKRRM